MNTYGKWYALLILMCATQLFAVTPTFNDYKDTNNTFQEFRNFSDNAQDKSFTQVTSTPGYADLKDGEMVIYISTPKSVNVNLMLRVGATLYVSPNFPIIQGR